MAVCNLHWIPSHIEVGERVKNKQLEVEGEQGEGEGEGKDKKKRWMDA